MSTSPAPAPTSPLAGPWAPLSGNRNVYTYSFLAAIGFLTAIVLFFMARAYRRRRRFALRVQQALDSGRLDPSVVDEIIRLPSGALYFGRPKKPRKHKVKPKMYEVQLGGAGGHKSSSKDEGADRIEKGKVDWNTITPIAVSKLTLPTQKDCQNISSNAEVPPPRPDDPSASNGDSLIPVAPEISRIALSVFISMPSLPTKEGHGDDAEETIPDICFGVAQVDVTNVKPTINPNAEIP